MCQRTLKWSRFASKKQRVGREIVVRLRQPAEYGWGGAHDAVVHPRARSALRSARSTASSLPGSFPHPRARLGDAPLGRLTEDLLTSGEVPHPCHRSRRGRSGAPRSTDPIRRAAHRRSARHPEAATGGTVSSSHRPPRDFLSTAASPRTRTQHAEALPEARLAALFRRGFSSMSGT